MKGGAAKARVQLLRVALVALAAVGAWMVLKLVLVPEDPLFIWVASDKELSGVVSFETITPWARSGQRVLSPVHLTPQGAPPRDVTITIEPLGQANPRARGSEIWLYEIRSELDRFGGEDWSSLQLPPPWKHAAVHGAAVFIGGSPTPLAVHLRAAGKVTLHLLRHPWSGQARITVDGVSRVVDLYAPEGRQGRVCEEFLLPVPIEVIQRMEITLPRTAHSFSLTFSGGPRFLRILRAEWHTRGLWVWIPRSDRARLTQNAEVLEETETNLLLRVKEGEGGVSFEQLHARPFFLPGPWGVTVMVVLGFLFWAVLEAIRPSNRLGLFLRNRFYWTKYALPCAAIWVVYWLAFFPGLMSPDSIGQWRQVVEFQLSDAHPAFHTLTWWLVTRIWLSPAAIALAQILTMSALIGWGLARVGRLGAPPAVPWAIAGFLALSPVMGMMVISLWKDILYAMCVLWSSLLLLDVVSSRGEWFASRRGPVLLGVSLALVALFRHQGVIVAVGTFVVLGLTYRRFWRPVAVAFVIASAIYGFVRGPLYRMLDVAPIPTFVVYAGAVHQVAAVVAAGTALTPEERALLGELFPADEWASRYRCTSPHSIIYDPRFNVVAQQERITEFRALWLRLIFRNPLAVARHQLCAGALVWVVPPLTYLYTVERGIVPNTLGLSTHSQWPAARTFICNLVGETERPQVIWFTWRPALYLYALLLAVLIVALRTRQVRWFLFALPAVLQSASLLVVNTGQDFRYQFSVYILGVMGLCLLFASRARRDPHEKVDAGGTDGPGILRASDS